MYVYVYTPRFRLQVATHRQMQKKPTLYIAGKYAYTKNRMHALLCMQIHEAFPSPHDGDIKPTGGVWLWTCTCT